MATTKYSGGAGIHLQSLVLDSSTTSEQKVDCLKLLKLVIKNLADPVKSGDVKYRTLKLDNPKVQSKFLPSGFEYLKAIGFVETTDEEGARVLRIDSVNSDAMNASLTECTNALDIVAKSQPQSSASVAATNKKPRVASEENKKTSDTRPLVKSASMERLSEKQKARLLMEEKAQREKDEARKHREMTSKLIKQDKHVRKNDPNWKSGVCAAAGKTGSSISTFRDRHGEN